MTERREVVDMKTLEELGYEIVDWFPDKLIYIKPDLKTQIAVDTRVKTAMKIDNDDTGEFDYDELKAVIALLEGSKCRH